MEIAFSDVTEDGLSLTIDNDGWFPHEEIGLTAPVECSIVVKKIDNDSVKVTGEMKYVTQSTCDKCCRDFEQQINLDFNYDCTVREDETASSQDSECTEENYEKLFLEGPVVDIDAILREQAILGLPVRNICSSSCLGLCLGCGADLDAQKCQCGEQEKPSPFSVLKHLKGR
ncbi:MAG: DUF177 domain-containing protein [Desulfobulbaceae bacterium]|nr:MAG: DUF177 domain-containing protein [Desulfobulbaceae bacterium]